jgi:hypothetical protein
MKKVLINGLNEEQVSVIMSYVEDIYKSGKNTWGMGSDMDWVEDGMDISGDDLIHELFADFGSFKRIINRDEIQSIFTLNIDGRLFVGDRDSNGNWSDNYYESNIKNKVEVEETGNEENVHYAIDTLIEVIQEFSLEKQKERLQSCIDILEQELEELKIK